ncbi:hypothetical protein EDB85DRAFT_1595378 [Lactarius pseudohatsudake]|nr:hypothetical protein EDB85DRAFT_1595378 [Lactarius pseudohatsudake]
MHQHPNSCTLPTNGRGPKQIPSTRALQWSPMCIRPPRKKESEVTQGGRRAHSTMNQRKRAGSSSSLRGTPDRLPNLTKAIETPKIGWSPGPRADRPRRKFRPYAHEASETQEGADTTALSLVDEIAPFAVSSSTLCSRTHSHSQPRSTVLLAVGDHPR